MSYTAFTPNPSVTPDATPPVIPFENGQLVASDTALKAIATSVASGANLPAQTTGTVGAWVRVANNVNGFATGGYTIWTLIAGTHADAPTTGFSQPTDYNASTNQKYWQQLNFPY
jgi:hypothetical protein